MLLREGAVIRGRVVLQDHTGVNKSTVTVAPVSESASVVEGGAEAPASWWSKAFSETGEDGYYEVPHLSPGEYSLAASHPDYAPSDAVTVVLQEGKVWEAPPLVLLRGGIILGTVTEKGEAREGVRVCLDSGFGAKKSVTGEDGQFEFVGLRAGEYKLEFLCVSASGKRLRKTRSVSLEEEEIEEVTTAFC